MAESTSKLREQVLALTNVNGKGGFDIMTDGGKSFKSTYSIMQGISKVWKDMSDVDQANNIIACMYRNMHILTHLNPVKPKALLLQYG